jgi:hypothetical protein
MRECSTTDNLMDSSLTNDPYYPRPGSESWESFCLGYLYEAAHNALDLVLVQQVLRSISVLQQEDLLPLIQRDRNSTAASL